MQQGSPQIYDNSFEVHDKDALAHARGLLDAAADAAAMGREVLAAVGRNARWRGEQCINLLAPEAPTSPGVRAIIKIPLNAAGFIPKSARIAPMAPSTLMGSAFFASAKDFSTARAAFI